MSAPAKPTTIFEQARIELDKAWLARHDAWDALTLKDTPQNREAYEKTQISFDSALDLWAGLK